MDDDRCGVAGVARVVAARQAIGLAAAAAEMHQYAAIAAGLQRAEHGAHIGRARAAFEAMQHQYAGPTVVAGAGQIEEIAVRQFESFNTQARARRAPAQRRPQGR